MIKMPTLSLKCHIPCFRTNTDNHITDKDIWSRTIIAHCTHFAHSVCFSAISLVQTAYAEETQRVFKKKRDELTTSPGQRRS